MKIKYKKRCSEIGRLSDDYDFLLNNLGEVNSLSGYRLVNFLNQLELRINDLIKEVSTDEVESYFTRVKFIHFRGDEIKLNLNCRPHRNAYFLHCIFKLGHECYEEGNALEIEY